MADDDGFHQLVEFLTSARGLDLTAYRHPTLRRRIEKRMRDTGRETFAEYMNYLEVTPGEFTELLNTILINVTSFFRDAEAWKVIADTVVPSIIEEKDRDEPIRVWSAGCASGEEAFTIAMVLAEALGAEEFQRRVKIYGTDIDDDALQKARHGTYSQAAIKGIPADLLAKYFEHYDNQYVFNRELRRNVVFGRIDLLQDAPISRVDLLICRNTLMYFNGEAQSRVISRFVFALGDNGFLFLGKAETLLSHTAAMSPVNLRLRIFAKAGHAYRRDAAPPAPESAEHGQAEQAPARSAVTIPHTYAEMAFQAGPLPQFIIGTELNIVAANERARRLLNIGRGDINQPIHRVGRALKLANLWEAFDAAIRDGRTEPVSDIGLSEPGEGERLFSARIVPLREGAKVSALATVFLDVTDIRKLEADLERSKGDLQIAYEELQSANEELETTNEELQSTVEELETTNEELQSTNEELETMNEELQSTNDELEAVNTEIRRRGAESEHTNRFLEAILSTLRVGVASLNEASEVQSWNATAQELWGLREEEVVGKDFFSLDIGFPVEKLRDSIRDCLSSGDRQELTVTAINRRGQSFDCRVECVKMSGGEPPAVILLMGMGDRPDGGS